MRVTPVGEFRSSDVADLARVSARSFPLIPEWLGHQAMLTFQYIIRELLVRDRYLVNGSFMTSCLLVLGS